MSTTDTDMKTLMWFFLIPVLVILLPQTKAKTLSDLIPDWKNVTDGLNCDNIAGYVVCNGTNYLYENSTSALSESAIKLQRKIIQSSDTSRSGYRYSHCIDGLDSGCTVMESILIPTYLTNSIGQPRFIYQNKHVGVIQEIRLSVCRSTRCGGHPHNTCTSHTRHLMLIAINPHRPHELILDTFAVRGCCRCETPWDNVDEFPVGGPNFGLNYPFGQNPNPGEHFPHQNFDYRRRLGIMKNTKNGGHNGK